MGVGAATLLIAAPAVLGALWLLLLLIRHETAKGLRRVTHYAPATRRAVAPMALIESVVVVDDEVLVEVRAITANDSFTLAVGELPVAQRRRLEQWRSTRTPVSISNGMLGGEDSNPQ